MQEQDHHTNYGKGKYLVEAVQVQNILTLKNQLGMELERAYGGYNCRHNYYPYFEGSERSYTDQELEVINNKKVTYNNKEYSEYEAVQMQRNAERNIRAAKRELSSYQAIIESSEDNLKLEAQNKFNIGSIRLKKQQDELKEFIEQTELTRDRTRERVAVFDRGLSKKVEKTSKSILENKKIHDIIDIDKIDIDGITKEGKESLKKAYSTALNHGLSTNTETLLNIDKTTGENVTIKHDGSKAQVSLTGEDIAALSTWPKNNVICIHNHPSNSSFSSADLSVMCSFESISDMTVIGHGNTVYTISIGEGQRMPSYRIQSDYHDLKMEKMDYYRNKILNNELTQKEAWYMHSNEILENLSSKYGWKYRRYEFNEKNK